MKIRHYGFLANRHEPLLQLQQKEMGMSAAATIKKDWKTILKEKMNFDMDQCPCCKKARPDDLVGRGRMTTILNFEANAPPAFTSLKLNTPQNKTTA
jgi:hypothetical protein